MRCMTSLVGRKDLKVIITSATIDAERFAKHFEINGKPAPVFTISGRTYPVQIRWRPVDDTDEADDKTLMDAVADACDELQIAGRGDILVFLPGEREIREAAEVLRARNRPGLVEILPLYARLSAQEQERVFKSLSRPSSSGMYCCGGKAAERSPDRTAPAAAGFPLSLFGPLSRPLQRLCSRSTSTEAGIRVLLLHTCHLLRWRHRAILLWYALPRPGRNRRR